MTDMDAQLFAAAEQGDATEALLALDAGADVNATRGDPGVESDEQPLLVAARRGHRELVQLLLGRGAAVNNGYRSSTPALVDALIAGRTDIANLLYRHGALSGLLLGFCFSDNYAAIHEILSFQPDRWREYAMDSIRAGNVEMLAENLARNPQITPAEDGFVLVRSAIAQWRLMHNAGPPRQSFDRSRYQIMTRMLLEWGVPPNITNAKGETLLHMCASYGRDWSPNDDERAAHAKILIEFGADVRLADATGETPVARAVRMQRQALTAVLQRATDGCSAAG